MFALPPATQALLIVNVLVYMVQQSMGNQLIVPFALWTFGAGDEPGNFHIWQLVTYSFLHGSFTHLLFNMLALYMFGSDIERLWGQKRYTIYYFGCVVSAAIAQLAVSAFMGSGSYPTVGASGGVFGLLLAFGMMFPRRMVMLLFPPIPMRAWVLVTAYGAIELFMGITGTQSGVAHFAHLGGMAGGFLLIQYWRGRLPIRPGRR
jgi:membrane associated rhomboid family serine protease